MDKDGKEKNDVGKNGEDYIDGPLQEEDEDEPEVVVGTPFLEYKPIRQPIHKPDPVRMQVPGKFIMITQTLSFEKSTRVIM